jgi:hypothetical protein
LSQSADIEPEDIDPLGIDAIANGFAWDFHPMS